ncbi:hypothetical protein Ahy_B10g103372 [Arachis hypogaea]|uniref:Protein FAR1-RELATED SEQUENCE n=1 Tax=Arachis hypogaea TaxID=3818 RepID=A0A444X3L1_ARAHY|nr:hypothetical protein Ahy_B10g103372 [Arachis hypogaea]
MFTKIMLFDYEVGVLKQKWEKMVGYFGVEDREWIIDMYGILCSHILAVLDFLDIVELPKILVLRRWTRRAKEGISGYDDIGGLMEDSLAISRHACLTYWCKQVMNEGCLKGDLFNESQDAFINILSWIRAHSGDDNMIGGMQNTYMKALKRMEVLRQRPQKSLRIAATIANEVITYLHVS